MRYKGPTQSHVAYATVFFMLDVNQGINAILGNQLDYYQYDQLIQGFY